MRRAHRRGGQRSELHRVVINTATGKVSRQSLSHRCCEFPTIPAVRNGRPAKYLYTPASAVEDPYHWGPNQVRIFLLSYRCSKGFLAPILDSLTLGPTLYRIPNCIQKHCTIPLMKGDAWTGFDMLSGLVTLFPLAPRGFRARI